MESFTEVIDELGGTEKLASALNKKYPTVAAWKQRDSIPGEFWADVAALPKAREVGLTVEGLAKIARDRRAA